MPSRKQPVSKQKSLVVDQFTLLKKPLDHLGKQMKVPGSFWQGRMSAEERCTDYMCTVIDFSLVPKFTPDSHPVQAFQMQEMGTDGKGSLEKSDIESTKFWMQSPAPPLPHTGRGHE